MLQQKKERLMRKSLGLIMVCALDFLWADRDNELLLANIDKINNGVLDRFFKG